MAHRLFIYAYIHERENIRFAPLIWDTNTVCIRYNIVYAISSSVYRVLIYVYAYVLMYLNTVDAELLAFALLHR